MIWLGLTETLTENNSQNIQKIHIQFQFSICFNLNLSKLAQFLLNMLLFLIQISQLHREPYAILVYRVPRSYRRDPIQQLSERRPSVRYLKYAVK